MKVLMNTLSFAKPQIQNREKHDSYYIKDSLAADSVSFGATVSDKKLLQQMLTKAETGVIRTAKGTRINETGNVISRAINKGLSILRGENRNYTNYLIQEYFNKQGLIIFLKTNSDFFERIINYAEANSIPAKRFKEEIKLLAEDFQKPEKAVLTELERLTEESRILFIKNGRENGEIGFVSNEENKKFLNEVYNMMIGGKGKKPVNEEVTSKQAAENIKSVKEKVEPAKENIKPLDEMLKPKVDLAKPIIAKEKSFDAQALLKEYWDLCFKQKDLDAVKTEEEKLIWKEQDEKIREIYNKLRTNNISFVVKEEFDPNPAVDIDKKRAYFNSWKVKHSGANEASKMDFLEMFEKYGDRYYNQEEPWNSPLLVIATTVSSHKPTSDAVLRKYIDLMDKIAIKDSKVQQDVVTVNWVLENNIETMSEETVLKFIEVMKKIAFEQREGQTADTAIRFSRHKNNPEIKAALNDFIDSLKDDPYEVPLGG